MATEKKQSFFGGAAVLAAGVVIVKIIGALFKIPLANILGETGNADFNNAYNIYAVLLTISTAGLPVALSKMISEAKTLGRERQARRVLKVSFAAFLTLGVLSFVIMWFGNEKCAALLNNPNAAYGIKALAPGVVCVGCLAAFRGFAQGSFRMTPTAVSQIIEAVSKLFIGLGLSMYVVSLGYEDYIAAAAAIVGVTVGSVLALVYMPAHPGHRHAGCLRRDLEAPALNCHPHHAVGLDGVDHHADRHVACAGSAPKRAGLHAQGDAPPLRHVFLGHEPLQPAVVDDDGADHLRHPDGISFPCAQ